MDPGANKCQILSDGGWRCGTRVSIEIYGRWNALNGREDGREDVKARGRRFKSPPSVSVVVKYTMVTDSGPLAWEDGTSFGPLVKS